MTVLCGLCVDITVAFALAEVFAVPLRLAAASGLLLAVGFNYVLFEKWVFGTRATPLTLARLVKTVFAAGLAMIVRVATVWAVETLMGPVASGAVERTFVPLGVGVAASFVVNFLIVKRVFKADRLAKP